jgi:putative endonuclease
MFFYVYVLQSQKHPEEFYYGYTGDLQRRIKEHNQKKNFSTKRYQPWKLIHYEACLSEQDAIRREEYLKTSQGSRMLRRRIKDYLDLVYKNFSS